MDKKKKLIIISVLVTVALLAIIVGFMISNNKNTTNNNRIVTYNVSFDTEGGTSIDTQVINAGEKVKKPIDPEKDGYIFVEWVYQGETYDFSLDVTSDIKLIAKWIEKKEDIITYVVKFDSDGGTTIPNQIIDQGNKVVKPSDPLKEGYIFRGWTLNGETYNFDIVVEKNLELKAKWEKAVKNNTSNNNSNKNNNDNNKNNNTNTNTNNNANNNANTTVKKYTVSFNSNGGTNVENQIIENGKTVSKPNNPTRSGYTFIEWQLNGVTFNFDNKINSNITLVAVWKNNTWDIDSSTGAIIKYKGNDSNITIPSTIDGVTISKINSNAFASSTIESVVIPPSINKIENSAFLKTSNRNLTKVYVKNNLWKSTNWNFVFGTSGSAYTTGNSGILIRSAYTLDACNAGEALYGSGARSCFVRVINSDGIYPIYYNLSECRKLNGSTGPFVDEIPYYVTSDSYTLYKPGYSNFQGWIGDNGDTPQKNVVIPAGSTGEKHYTAVCS